MAADPGRRSIQRSQPQRLRAACTPDAAEVALLRERPGGLGAQLRDRDRIAFGLPGQQRQGNARRAGRAGSGLVSPYSRAVFEAYWRDDIDISQDPEIEKIAISVGLDGDAFMQEVRSSAYKARLRENTEELIERGGFGSPTIFVDGGDMYFGNDRLPLVLEALCRPMNRSR